MTINILRRRNDKRKEARPPGAIGEPDAHVFNCPKCARPLSNGTPKCQGCGQRLILGVALRRASLLAGLGLILGVFLGAVLTSGAITGLLSSAAAAVAAQVGNVTPSATPSAIATDAPVVTPVPVVEVGIPPAAISALTQTTLLDSRIVNDAGDLDAALASKSTVDIARAMRALASDAANGSVQVARLKTWSEAGTVVAFRVGFYDRIADRALDSLKRSLTEGKAYRNAAASMLTILADLPGLDAMSRGLAVAAEIELPLVEFGVLSGG